MPKDRALIRQLYVKVNGTALEQKVMNDLFAAEVESSLHLPAMCTLRLHDPQAALTNSGAFALGATLDLGISDERGRGESPLFAGEITGLEPDYAERLTVTLTVRAYDRSHRLHRGVHTRAYEHMSDSDIATAIAQEVGLRPKVDASTPTHEHVYQDGQTHMQFLRTRARRIGYSLHVQDRTLRFEKAGASPSETVRLEWGVQLRRFRPVLTLGAQVSEVVVKGWSASNKQEIVGKAQASDAAPRIGESQSGAQLAEDAFGAAADLRVYADVADQSEADSIAQAVMDERTGSFVEAEGLCYGDPRIVAGCVVELSALGQRFNGRYAVTAATHSWNTAVDYVTEFRVTGRRPDTWRELLGGDIPIPQRWYAMTGIVTNNNDPQGTGRVRVKFPWLDGQIESAWARLVAVGAGTQRGLYCLPEVNDEVLVLFEQGDMDRPLVIGGLWNGSDAPPESISQAVANGQVRQRVFATRRGHKLIFQDEDSATITLQSAGGHTVVMDDDAQKIEVKTSGGQTITLDDSGQTLKVKASGMVQVEADQNLTLKASGNMNIEANGTVTIKGSLIQLNP